MSNEENEHLLNHRKNNKRKHQLLFKVADNVWLFCFVCLLSTAVLFEALASAYYPSKALSFVMSTSQVFIGLYGALCSWQRSVVENAMNNQLNFSVGSSQHV
jgi:hypothetical protein